MSKDDAEQPNKTEAVVDEPDIPIDDGKVDLVHSEARYLGYSAALARGFRYLAFTSGTNCIHWMLPKILIYCITQQRFWRSFASNC